MKFNIHYDEVVNYDGYMEVRTGIHSFSAKDEAEAIDKTQRFFDNESVLSWDAIIEGIGFVAYLER